MQHPRIRFSRVRARHIRRPKPYGIKVLTLHGFLLFIFPAHATRRSGDGSRRARHATTRMKTKDNDSPASFSLIADFDGDMDALLRTPHDTSLPGLALRNMMLFPGVVGSVTVGRETSLKVIEHAVEKDDIVAVFPQKDAGVEAPGFDDLYTEGVAARVMRTMRMPNDTVVAILQSCGALRLLRVKRRRPVLRVEVEHVEETIYSLDDKEFAALVDACREAATRYLKLTETARGEGAAFALQNISHPVFLINFICTNMPLDGKDRFALFAEHDLKKRAIALLQIVNRECQFAQIKHDIQDQTRQELDKQQKEYFLQQQIKNIQSELGNGENADVAALEQKAAGLQLPEKTRAVFDREMEKLRRTNPQNPDYNVQLNFLQTVVSLPWGVTTQDNLNIKNAARILDRDHYGMERVKERILEHLATLRYRKQEKAPILCLYGPPGVGKTSLGKSIAEALGRKYVRISLGGLHDEAEIRGHRRTYVGAMPGRIIKGMMKAGTNNPLFVLDEIDKVSENNYNGDPHSALLEVLDPEQNDTFHDNFIDLDYDLSQVFFIATANSLQGIPRPLLDRMEVIAVEGYLTEEKKEIARRHLIPKEQRDYDFGEDGEVRVTPAAVELIVERYTRESGVRQLEKQLGKVFRKIAYLTSTSKDGKMPYAGGSVKPADIESLLGKPLFSRDRYQGNGYAGVVTGLAWTPVGGEILFIETSLSRSKGAKLTLTGNLGDVMKESAVLALEYVKSHAGNLGIDYRAFDSWSVHIHVPEGATPKDGPSAGITIATSIASALTQRKVRDYVAMTGEITLRGRVLPVGGIKEKILAAKRAGITDIVISEENRKDIEEINGRYVQGVSFHFVSDVSEVLRYALLEEKVAHPLDIAAGIGKENGGTDANDTKKAQ